MIRKIFTLPIKTLIALAEKIEEEADKELYDTSSIQRQLVELYSLHEQGLISEDSYKEREADLMQRYKTARQRATDSLSHSDH